MTTAARGSGNTRGTLRSLPSPQPTGERTPEPALGIEAGPHDAAGRDTDGERLPSVRERLCPPMPRDALLGWLGPLLVTAVAGLLRFVQLGHPRLFIFDETYYAKDAYALLQHGVEYNAVDNANELILDGRLDVFTTPSFIAHPPAGKWLIAVGEWLFGMSPFGWRFTVAVLGTLSVLLIARIVRRLTRSTLLGCVAGLLLAFDGLHFVQSRIALLDPILAFWLLAAFGALVADRDWARRRFAAAVGPLGRLADSTWGPVLWWRPWRLVAGMCFGLAVATKWNALYVLAVFGLMTVLWDAGARRTIGVRGAHLRTAVADGVPAFVSLVGVALAVYVASWAGWFASSDGTHRDWAADRPASGLASVVPDALRSWWHYQAAIYDFHTQQLDDATHQYASHPAGWLALSRPVSFHWEDKVGAARGCEVDRCVQEILGLGTPALWWGALAALVACGVVWVGARDWRFGIPLVGVAATWLPWFLYTDRPIFSFYTIAILPWLVIAVTLVLGMILGSADAGRRRMWGAAVVGGYVLLVLLNFAYLYPILAAETIPYAGWLQRMWLPSWV